MNDLAAVWPAAKAHHLRTHVARLVDPQVELENGLFLIRDGLPPQLAVAEQAQLLLRPGAGGGPEPQGRSWGRSGRVARGGAAPRERGGERRNRAGRVFRDEDVACSQRVEHA